MRITLLLIIWIIDFLPLWAKIISTIILSLSMTYSFMIQWSQFFGKAKEKSDEYQGV